MRTGEQNAARGRWASGIAAGLGILWLAIFPLAGGFSYANLTLAKWNALRIGALVTLAGLGALYIRQGKLRGQSVSLSLMGAALAWIGLSCAFGAMAGETTASGIPLGLIGARYEGLLSWLCYGVIFLALSQAGPSQKPVTAAAAAALSAQLALIAAQYAGLNPLGFFPAETSILSNHAYQGTLGNIDMLAGYLALAIPFTALPWLTDGGSWRSACAAAGMGGALLCLMTGVQAGYVSLAALGLGVIFVALTQIGRAHV